MRASNCNPDMTPREKLSQVTQSLNQIYNRKMYSFSLRAGDIIVFYAFEE